MKLRLAVVVSAFALSFAFTSVAAAASAQSAGSGQQAAVAKKKKKKKKKLTVCKHGCKYRTIQKAVNKAGKKWTIKVKPGKYREGVLVKGHRYDGLRIVGTGKKPKDVIIEGTDAKGPGGLAQHGIEGTGVNNLKVENMKLQNFATNGVFVHGENGGCNGYLMKNLIAVNNRSYGLYAFNCIGGRMTQSTGWGHGDSAFYVGQTPPQTNPVWTSLDHLDGHLNVLGYSGTNSKYVKISDSDFYNNGIGLVPNTLDSEDFEPADDGIIENNRIFWNNLNEYVPCEGAEEPPVCSPVQVVGSVGDFNYPTGIGVALFGAEGWKVRNNQIFGHYLWGTGLFSDPFNSGGDAMSHDNEITNNTNGRGGTDPNAADLYADGSGEGNCFSGNVSSTMVLGTPGPTNSQAFLYPTCPAPAPPTSGTGNSTGDPEQLGKLLSVATANPPEKQECFWTKTPHPPFENFQPYEVTGGPTCP